ncbi:MAG TPA: glycoside hydrolase family 44 protein [Fibrobacteria bacterium]|nr:glycoside hydrolase family 44 protein [Fibrobacteria bacterium]
MIAILMAAPLWTAAVQISVDADSGRIPIHPAILGKNNDLSDSDFTVYREAGLKLLRASAGNNATKYNWRNGLSCHPDWYNNVYANDWDAKAKSIQSKLPGGQGMFAFQLLGWVAANDKNNFNDWNYNQSAWWDGTVQNLAGGGTPNSSGGGKASVEGDPRKYLTAWGPDSTAGILDHWFQSGGLGLDSARFRYWGMDNEPDGWVGTHDDVVPALTGAIDAEDYVQRWVAVAKAVRKKMPHARLVGPATMTEWQWYTWNDESVTYRGRSMSFPEYFILRLADIQDSTGIRMIDVYDVHLYLNIPGSATMAQNLQTHRILYDTTYVFPWANGVKTVDGGWDESIKREYIFLRLRRWLDTYFGPDNGIGIGSTESGIGSSVSDNASATAVWHASMLGTMADHGTELYTPWFWYPGMWESTHLFGRVAKSVRVRSRSSLDTLVSAYGSISVGGDSLVVILVNRASDASRDVVVSLGGFSANAEASTLQLSKLSGETFVSHAANGLKAGTVAVSANTLNLALPTLSVTAVVLTGKGSGVSGSLRRASARFGMEHGVARLEGSADGWLELFSHDGSLERRVPVREGRASLDLTNERGGLKLLRWPGASKAVFLAP